MPFACRKVVGTQIDYPPIPGSQTSVNINGETVTLGYSPTDHRVALQLRLDTQPFLPNCTAPDPVQLLFPHHSKSLHPGQRPQVDGRYTWNTIMGPLKLYKGSSFVQLIDTDGFLPFFPDQAVDSDLQNPLQSRQLAVDDVYETMRNWFYLEEFQTGGNHIDSFLRNIGTYDNQQFNTYEQGLSTLIESMMIADQLAHSTKLTGNDTSTNSLHACLCKPKTQVAAEMRDYILQALKELVGQWADVYTAQFIQDNPTFKTTYGFPAGFGSVQNSAAIISTTDIFCARPQLSVATTDRGSMAICRSLRNCARMWRTTIVPILITHSCATSARSTVTSGPMAPAKTAPTRSPRAKPSTLLIGLMELGLLLGNNEWRDMGMYTLRAGDTRFGAGPVQSGCNAAECCTAPPVRP